MLSRSAVIFQALIFLGACRAHRPVVEIQPNDKSQPSLTDGGGSITSTLKITAVSLPPQPYAYDRLEVNVQDPNLPDRMQHVEDYKLSHAIPVKAHKNYNLIVRAYVGEEALYSNEYCKVKKNGFRSMLGETLLTISLCENPSPEGEDESPTTPP